MFQRLPLPQSAAEVRNPRPPSCVFHLGRGGGRWPAQGLSCETRRWIPRTLQPALLRLALASLAPVTAVSLGPPPATFLRFSVAFLALRCKVHPTGKVIPLT